ncbi:hypothetical protein GYA54_03465 [Candidatus Kuenenbacteria bacterium]|nr:hypothetical protein [Candidatus Kuenenbacteria bacterium]
MKLKLRQVIRAMVVGIKNITDQKVGTNDLFRRIKAGQITVGDLEDEFELDSLDVIELEMFIEKTLPGVDFINQGLAGILKDNPGMTLRVVAEKIVAVFSDK